jgi:hypothetical protein
VPDELVDDLRATQDVISEGVARLTTIEDEKRELEPADPEVDHLSSEARGVAEGIARLTVVEEDLAGQIRDE